MRLIPILLLILLGSLAAFGAGVEVQIQFSAIQTALAGQMFGTDGRYWVRGDPAARCNFAYLADPAVGGNAEGKLIIRTRFAGRTASNFFGFCLGPGDVFDLNIVATPYYKDGSIRLKEVTVDSLGRESYYAHRVREAVQDALPRKFDYKAADEARKIIERETGGTGLRHELKDFQISGIRVTPEAVILTVEFTLVVR